MSMKVFFDGMYGDMSAIFTEVFGTVYTVTTERHGVIEIEAVYKMDRVETMIGGHGASQRMPFARLDFRRDQLVAAGLTDPENDLHGAQVVIDGRVCSIVDPEDDGRVMVRCRIAKTAARAP